MSGSNELSRILAAERAAGPPPGSSAAGLERLLGSMAKGVAPLPVAAGSLKLGVSLISKWIGVGFVVGLAGAGAATLATPASPPPVAQVHVLPAAPSEPVVAAVTAPRPEEPVVVEAPTPEPVTSASRSNFVAPSAPASASAPNLDEELRLIAGAKRELDGNRAPLALRWLSEHRQRFPKGMLALEREGLQALASCSSAPRPDVGRAFAKHYPRSPMLGQVLRRCGLAESAAAPSAATFSESSDANGGLGEPTSR